MAAPTPAPTPLAAVAPAPPLRRGSVLPLRDPDAVFQAAEELAEQDPVTWAPTKLASVVSALGARLRAAAGPDADAVVETCWKLLVRLAHAVGDGSDASRIARLCVVDGLTISDTLAVLGRARGNTLLQRLGAQFLEVLTRCAAGPWPNVPPVRRDLFA